ncbi:MAG TPA: hypothetical protein VGC13_01025 [Longimicrobium sp.]|jgi:hypothetical protein|uniref:hypothetical protein n=1 Tax=Longimicrobium sp. TaxID=2029185 RepID=UPI002EDB17F9
MEPELVLRGVFVHLVEHGFRLGVRDYLDALRALRGGFGGQGRRELLRMCQTLWARTEAEARTIALFFDRIPVPTPDDVATLTGAPRAEETPRERVPRQPGGERGEDAAAAEEKGPALGVSFTPAAQDALGLPRAQASPASEEMFILTPRPVMPIRSLVIAWRRFRAASRTGPRVELDLDATVAAKCQTGLLEAPVLVPARRNLARVVVLMDASPSMQPWQGFGEVLEASLHQGQLGGWVLRFFDNVPDVLYRHERLLAPETVEHAVRAHAESTLLVISDAGAARGTRNRERIRATEAFLAAAHPRWRPSAWINPMPRARW